MRRSFIAFLLCLACLVLPGIRTLRAQDFYVGLNAAQIANLGTVSVTAGYALARHWSVDANVRLNLWQFGKVDESARYEDIVSNVNNSVFNKREGAAIGVRYWPWYVLSGFWFGARAQAATYDRGGWVFKERRKGSAFGGCLGAGWSWMVNSHFNLDFGVYGWAGGFKGLVYEDLYHTNRYAEEQGMFATLDEIVISVVYVF